MKTRQEVSSQLSIMAVILLVIIALFILVVLGVDGKIIRGGGVIAGGRRRLLQKPTSIHFITDELTSSPRRRRTTIINRGSTILALHDWMSTAHQATQATSLTPIDDDDDDDEKSSTRSEKWRSVDNKYAPLASAVSSIIVQSTQNSRSVLFSPHDIPRGGGGNVVDDDDDEISNKEKGGRRSNKKRRYNKPRKEEEHVSFLINNEHGVDSSPLEASATLSNNVDTSLTFSSCSDGEEKAPTVTKLGSNNESRSGRKRKRRIKQRQLQQQKEDDDVVVVDNNFILSSSSSSDEQQSTSSATAHDDRVDTNNDTNDASINPLSGNDDIEEIDYKNMSGSSAYPTIPRTKSRKKRRKRIMNDDSKDGGLAASSIDQLELEIDMMASSKLASQMQNNAMSADVFEQKVEAFKVEVRMMETIKNDEHNISQTMPSIVDNSIMNSDSSIVLPESIIIPRADASNKASSVIDDKELSTHDKEAKLDSIVETDLKGATNNVDANVSLLNEIVDVVNGQPIAFVDKKVDKKEGTGVNFESSSGGATNTHESVTVGESITLEEETSSTAAEMVDTTVTLISKQQDEECKSIYDGDETLKEETNDGDSLTLSIVTWNLGETEPSMEDASSFFGRFRNSDLVMIGAQECEDIKPRRTEGRRSRHFRRLSIMMLGENYVPLAIHSLGGIQCALYCHRNVLGEVDMIDVADVTCGVGGVFHNKGAIGIYLKMKRRGYDNEQKSSTKTSRILLITGHLAAHVTNVEARNADYKRIVSELETHAPIRFLHPLRNADGSPADCDGTHLLNSMDHVFFAGDLNYRINLPRESVERCIINIQQSRLANAHDHANLLMKKLLRQDQLLQTISSGRAFTNFCEGKVTFLPTFKFDKGTSDYDTSHKQRIPAWTDRIVFRSNKVNVLEYDSATKAKHSDHRPVFGTFKIGWGIGYTSSVSSKRKLKRAKSINRG